MKGLLLKDLAIVKTQRTYALVVILIAMFMLLKGNDVMFVISYANIIFVMLGINTLHYDAFDNGNSFLFTLPISRKTYVLEKYVFSMCSDFVGVSFSLILLVVVEFLTEFEVLTSENIASVLGLGCGAMVFLSIVLPIELKFGQEKSRIAMIVAIFVIVSVVYLVFVGGPVDLSGLAMKLDQMKPLVLVGIGAVIAACLVVISFLISCRIVENKEY